MDKDDSSNSEALPKMKNFISRASLVNHGTTLRPHAPAPARRPRPPGTGRPMRSSPSTSAPPANVESIDVEALLEDNDDASKQRQHVESFRDSAARQAANALQQWLSEHHDPPPEDMARWRRAYNVLTRLVGWSRELPEQLFVRRVNFKTDAPYARGGFADVFKGDHEGESVAVKRLHIGETPEQNREASLRFYREALIWYQLKHANIIALKGIYNQRAHSKTFPCMVAPWVDEGTIMSFIKSPKFDHRRQRLPLLIEVAEALQYIHRRDIAHGDFHGGNVLIHKGRALLTDFGLTVVGDKSQSAIPTTQLPAGAIRWLAPELVTNEDYSPRKTIAGDMFGFGRLCLAICCLNGALFPHLSDMQVAIKLSDPNGWHPSRPQLAECSGGVPMYNGLWGLAKDCWKLESEGQRPSAAEALQRLQSDQILL